MEIKRTIKLFRGIIKGLGYKSFGKSSNIISPMRIIGKEFITIGENVFILNGLRMEAISEWNEQFFTPNIIIGDDVNINQNCHITCANSVNIGAKVNILPDVLITDIEHSYQIGKSISETRINVGSVSIGECTTIGMGARILGSRNVRVGRNVVVGANSVVISDIPDNAIVVGSPGKVVKYLEYKEEVS